MEAFLLLLLLANVTGAIARGALTFLVLRPRLYSRLSMGSSYIVGGLR